MKRFLCLAMSFLVAVMFMGCGKDAKSSGTSGPMSTSEKPTKLQGPPPPPKKPN